MKLYIRCKVLYFVLFKLFSFYIRVSSIVWFGCERLNTLHSVPAPRLMASPTSVIGPGDGRHYREWSYREHRPECKKVFM